MNQTTSLNWWRKLDALRRESAPSMVPEPGSLDARIDEWLDRLLMRFAEGELRWRRWICAELGPHALLGNKRLRMAIEARLVYFETELSSPRYSELAGKRGGPPPG